MLSRGIYINTKSTIMKKNKTKTTKGEMGEREEEKKKGVPARRGRQHGLWREPTPPRFPRGGEPLALLVWALKPTPAAPKEKGLVSFP